MGDVIVFDRKSDAQAALDYVAERIGLYWAECEAMDGAEAVRDAGLPLDDGVALPWDRVRRYEGGYGFRSLRGSIHADMMADLLDRFRCYETQTQTERGASCVVTAGDDMNCAP